MKKLALPSITGNGKTLYDPQHIICCEGDENYTGLYLIRPEPPGWVKLNAFTYSLVCFEKWLHPYDFQRVSKSMVVNLGCVTDWEHRDKSIYIIVAPDCCGPIKLGDKWRDEFFTRLTINHIINPVFALFYPFQFFVC